MRGTFHIDSHLPTHPGYEMLSTEGKVAYLRSLAYCARERIAGLLDHDAQAHAFDRLSTRKRRTVLGDLIRYGFWLDEGEGLYSLPLEDQPDRSLGAWLTVVTAHSEFGGRWRVAQIPNPTYTRRSYIPAGVRDFVMRRDQMVCGLCGHPVPEHDMHLDHIVPWSLGGPDTPDNLQVAHSLCNISKGNRT